MKEHELEVVSHTYQAGLYVLMDKRDGRLKLDSIHEVMADRYEAKAHEGDFMLDDYTIVLETRGGYGSHRVGSYWCDRHKRHEVILGRWSYYHREFDYQYAKYREMAERSHDCAVTLFGMGFDYEPFNGVPDPTADLIAYCEGLKDTLPALWPVCWATGRRVTENRIPDDVILAMKAILPEYRLVPPALPRHSPFIDLSTVKRVYSVDWSLNGLFPASDEPFRRDAERTPRFLDSPLWTILDSNAFGCLLGYPLFLPTGRSLRRVGGERRDNITVTSLFARPRLTTVKVVLLPDVSLKDHGYAIQVHPAVKTVDAARRWMYGLGKAKVEWVVEV